MDQNKNVKNKKTSSNVERTTTGNANDYNDRTESGNKWESTNKATVNRNTEDHNQH